MPRMRNARFQLLNEETFNLPFLETKIVNGKNKKPMSINLWKIIVC